jgi:hypothetical protein
VEAATTKGKNHRNQSFLNHNMQFYSFSIKKNDQNIENRTRMLRITNLLDVEDELSPEVNG